MHLVVIFKGKNKTARRRRNFWENRLLVSQFEALFRYYLKSASGSTPAFGFFVFITYYLGLRVDLHIINNVCRFINLLLSSMHNVHRFYKFPFSISFLIRLLNVSFRIFISFQINLNCFLLERTGIISVKDG